MNWLDEQQQEDEQEIYQQHLKYLQKLFPPQVILLPKVDFWRITDSLKCPLCYLLIQDPVYLSCSHRFCKECFINYNPLLSQRICPICNTYLQSKNLLYQDCAINQFTQFIFKCFVQFENKKDMKRQESAFEQNGDQVKMFRSNRGEAVIIKQQTQVAKIKIQEQDGSKIQIEIDRQTMCCETNNKEEINQKCLQIIKARSFIVLKPRQTNNQNLHTSEVKTRPKLIKIRIERLPSDILTPTLNMQQLMVNENCSVKIISTLVAQQFNISRKQVDIFIKIGLNFIQLKSKDLVTCKIQDQYIVQCESKKKLQGLKFSMSKFIQNQYTYQNTFRSLKEIGTLYFSVRFSEMIPQ